MVLLMGVACAVLPWFTTLWPMLLAAFVMNAAGGATESASNFWTLKIWGSDAMTPFQINTLFYGLGSLIAPTVAAPFLSSHQPDDSLNDASHLIIGNMTGNISDHVVAPFGGHVSRIQYPYLMIGVLCIVLTGFFGFSYWRWPTDSKAVHETSIESTMSRRQTILVVFFMSCFSLGFAGICVVFPRYLTTFAVRGLAVSEQTGAYMTSVYWAGYTFSRVVTIPVAIWFGNKGMLMFNCVVMLLSSTMLILFGCPNPIHAAVSGLFGLVPSPDNSLMIGFWVAIVTLSIGASPTFALLFAFMENNMAVASWMPAMLSSVYGLGEFIYPFLLGATLDTIPEMLLYVVLVNSIICAIFLGLFIFAARRKNTNMSQKPPDHSGSNSIILID